jgi:glycosyltransferase involved in cell wall biosynthesis
MTATPDFSVVIAAFQAGETVAEAVESALAQTYPAREVIVCDDGSTDETQRMLEQFEDRIVVLRQGNAGEAAAKNAAIRAAHAEYVAILDADDLFLPRRLEALAGLAARDPDLDILTTDAVLEIDGRPQRRCYTDSWRFETDDQRRAILERNFVFGLVAVRRSRLLEIGGFDESIRYAADWDCWLRLILAGSRVGLVPLPLARYRLHPKSLSANRTALLDGRAMVLERAAARRELTPSERRAVESRAAAYRQQAKLAQVFEALITGAPQARSLALDLARASGLACSTRLRAAVAAAVPGACRAVLRYRARRVGRAGPAGLMLPVDF